MAKGTKSIRRRKKKKRRKMKAKKFNFKFGTIQMRSSWEVNIAKIMSMEKINWTYEPERFYFSDGTSYLPDFYLPKKDTWIEVKGRLSTVDMFKMREFVNLGKNLYLLRLQEYKQIMKGQLTVDKFLEIGKCKMVL